MPVILGEYGAYRRNERSQLPLDMTAHQNTVDYGITYVTKKAIDNNVVPFFWDIGSVIDRSNNKILDQRTIDAIRAGSRQIDKKHSLYLNVSEEPKEIKKKVKSKMLFLVKIRKAVLQSLLIKLSTLK